MEQSKGTFHDAFLKISPHYFDLFDVVNDQSSSNPQINSEELNKIIADPLTIDSEEDSLFVENNDSHRSNQNDDNTESQVNSHPNSWSSNNTMSEVVATTVDIVPVATPLVFMKWEKDTEKSSTTSKKKQHKCQDEMDMDTFFEFQKEASSLNSHLLRNPSDTTKKQKKSKK